MRDAACVHQEPYIPNDERGRTFLDAGTEIAGSTTGAVAGLFVGGPTGAVAGAALGPAAAQVLRWVAAEVGDRLIDRRGRARAMAAVIYAGERLEALRGEGAELRLDGFFDETPEGRNAAREVAEGVLLTARDAFEERKVRHIGYLFANVAVHDEIDAGLAALMLRRAEALTWRQYVLLAAVARAEKQPLPAGELSDDPDAWHGWGLRRELRDLYEAGYLHGGSKETPNMGLPYPNLTLSALRLAHQGVLVHHLLSLDLIPDKDATEVRDGLRLPATPNPEEVP